MGNKKEEKKDEKEDELKIDVRKLKIDELDKGKPRWYAVHTYSGYEDAVARYLKQRVESLSMENKIFDVIVPKERTLKIKSGKKIIAEEKIYPGYVLVKMILTEDSWYVVRNTPRVMGFVGPDSTKPTPLSKEEIEHLIAKMDDKDDAKLEIDIEEGDIVKIIVGPFKDYEGRVVSVDDQGRIKVSIPVFGRDTDVELESIQVQKI